ncbi:hypothetical protein BDN71DRAFT_1435032 [Pleurotus eryngii]|uniref:Uncharacterized protein n=1 Tax=Pleurotus eryngii TaxID=5323 RepID=A0A9P6DBQ4_PLEER|nr:hypothetical protein BDN71DRAFT_1435032 [Pleurotus eryngii]
MADGPWLLHHKVDPQAKTSTYTLQALEVLAKNVKIEHLNILKPLQQYYTHIIRFNVLDFVPVMEQATFLLQDPDSLTVHEVNESHITIAHLSRLKIVLQTIHFILYKVAAQKKEEGVDINLEEVKQIIKKL